MFPVRPDHLGVMAPIPAVATIPGSAKPLPVDPASVQALVEERFAEFAADLQPEGAVAQFLTRRAAFLSVRLDRLVRYDAAAVAIRVRRADGEYEANRLAEVDHLHSWINAEPATHARRLRQSPEGIDRMLQSWRGLRSELTDPDFPRWGADHLMLAESLTGRRHHDMPVSATRLYSEAYFGHPSALVEKNPELARLKPAQRQEFARVKLIAIIDDQVDGLLADRARNDLIGLDQDRREAADRALFDPTPTGTHARRYELATERSFHQAIRTIGELKSVPLPEEVVHPEVLVEANPDPTLVKPPHDDSFGKRSRRKVAFIQAAKRAAATRATTLQPPTAEPRLEPGSD